MTVRSTEGADAEATMRADAMKPFGQALTTYSRGERAKVLLVHRDDGHTAPIPVEVFFRPPEAFTQMEWEALNQCIDPVLDIGGGSGLHSLVLQTRGLDVTAIDISPEAVGVMQHRGVRNAYCGDIFEYSGGPYGTLLLLGHGIGMVEDMEGLERFLHHARRLVRPGGRILLDSLDVQASRDPVNTAYHERNRRSGRYIGETRVHFEFAGEHGPECGWLHVDPETLAEKARRTGWISTTLLVNKSGEHLSRLDHAPAANRS